MLSEHIHSSLQIPSASGEDEQEILAQNVHVLFPPSAELWWEAITAGDCQLYILEKYTENQLIPLFELRPPKEKKKQNHPTTQTWTSAQKEH